MIDLLERLIKLSDPEYWGKSQKIIKTIIYPKKLINSTFKKHCCKFDNGNSKQLQHDGKKEQYLSPPGLWEKVTNMIKPCNSLEGI